MMPVSVRKARKYMKLVEFAAKEFSTCGKAQYYAMILDEHGVVVGTGYNGGPSGAIHCDRGGCPRLNSTSEPGSVYDNCIAIHAEANAILHSDWHHRQDGTIIVNGEPCYSCAKLIANSGIKILIYKRTDRYKDWPRIERQLKNWGVRVIPVRMPES